MPIKYSVIVLLEKQYRDFAQFIQNLHDLFAKRQNSFEILIIANARGMFLREQLKMLQSCNDKIRAYEFTTRTTHAVCLKAGFKESSGEIIVVCGSYQQVTNESLSLLLDSFDDETDMINPCRQSRVDPWFNQFQSKVFNFLTRLATGTNLHDLSITVKIFRSDILQEIKVYGNMPRFLPILAARNGFKIKEIECEHYQEYGKTGFYSLSNYVGRVIDIFTLYFNTRFTKNLYVSSVL